MKPASLLFEDRAAEAPPSAPVAAPIGAPARSLARGLTLVVLIFLATRLVVFAGAYTGAAVVFCIRQHWEPPLNRYLNRFKEHWPAPDSPEYRTAYELLANFAPLCQFDGLNYKSIIERGYQYQTPPPDAKPTKWQQNIAFFPLYPMLCQLLTGAMTTEAAMILVAHLCGLAAAIVLYLWLRRRIDEPTALLAVAMVFCFPTACFHSFAYAESLTLLLLTAAAWLIDRRSFLPAAIVCALATATRPTALPIVAVFMLAWWFAQSDRRAPRLARLIPLTLVAAGGAICYGIYLTIRFGSPLVYWANFKAGWVPDTGRADWVEFLTLAPLWSQFQHLGIALFAFPPGAIKLADPFTWNMPLALFMVVLSVAGLRRVPGSFRPLLLLAPLIFVQGYVASGGASFGLDPLARYLAVATPTLILLAAWCRREWKPGARCALIAFMLLLQAAWAFRFALREWSG